jgi:hypothetical protein
MPLEMEVMILESPLTLSQEKSKEQLPPRKVIATHLPISH